MNKTITIYDLLTLIKDGKAPKKIKYNDMIYHINLDYGDYESDIEDYRYGDYKEHYYLFEDINIFTHGKETIEILDEEDELIEIKKIPYCEENTLTNMKTSSDISIEAEKLIDSNFKEIGNYINQLIHNQKILIEKMKEK